MKLVIGNKNYSTWSLRPWLLLRHFEVDFEEVAESLHAESLPERLARHSPSKRVPVLIDDDVTVWDSLAICEYVSEKYLEGAGWPMSRSARAVARSLSAEIHSGFGALRTELPMNLRAHREVDLSEAAKRDIARIDEIWRTQRAAWGDEGPWLFGGFSIADCMFAPVALRFPTYDVKMSDPGTRYMETIRKEPAVREWIGAALRETEIVDEDETGTAIDPA